MAQVGYGFDRLSPEDQDALIRTIYGEAENQGVPGWQAVAAVIGNRMKRTGQGVRDIVHAPRQFDAWTNPRRAPAVNALTPDQPIYNQIRQAVLTQADDPTGGATNFFSPAGGAQRPSWAVGQGRTIGGHEFYDAYGTGASEPQTTGSIAAAARPPAPTVARPGPPGDDFSVMLDIARGGTGALGPRPPTTTSRAAVPAKRPPLPPRRPEQVSTVAPTIAPATSTPAVTAFGSGFTPRMLPGAPSGFPEGDTALDPREPEGFHIGVGEQWQPFAGRGLPLEAETPPSVPAPAPLPVPPASRPVTMPPGTTSQAPQEQPSSTAEAQGISLPEMVAALQDYARPGVRVGRVEPTLSQRLESFLKKGREAGFNFQVNSGERGVSEQLGLQAKARRGGPAAGTPQGSKHVAVTKPDQVARAVDVGGTKQPGAEAWVRQNIGGFGLHRPIPGEPWHFENRGETGPQMLVPGQSSMPVKVTDLEKVAPAATSVPQFVAMSPELLRKQNYGNSIADALGGLAGSTPSIRTSTGTGTSGGMAGSSLVNAIGRLAQTPQRPASPQVGLGPNELGLTPFRLADIGNAQPPMDPRLAMMQRYR